MSEMALTADHLIVIAQGKLLADASTADVTAGSAGSYVLVRTPQSDKLRDLIRQSGANVSSDAVDPALRVTGMTREAIGDLASRYGITVHELTPHSASLETAYMELTRDHIDFQTDQQLTSAAMTGLDRSAT
jgi:ABC-2 type transport system ATP-binding protein